MRGLFQVSRPVEQRTLEASPQQIAATGAAGGAGYDPVDREYGWRRAGAGRREVPEYTRQRAVDSSVAGYRSNSMATAVIDTYVSFIVGDKGVSYVCSNAEVKKVVQEFWDDPKVKFGMIQPALLKSQMLWGELPVELMVGDQSGVVRLSVMDPVIVDKILLDRGNPLWPSKMVLTAEDGNEPKAFDLVQVDDETGLREGNAFFFAPWKTLVTDTRGVPFLTPILDQLDSYDTVLSNLIDRTSLARYLVWDVEVKGTQPQVDEYIKSRGGLHIPPSGSIEVHNESVTWEPKSAPSGAQEDTQAAGAVLTQIAGGAGLAKAQPLDCMVLTPAGWRAMGDLQVGDEVLTPKGVPSRITGVHPQGVIPTFEVAFSDGAVTRASGDHLWFTQTVQDRKHGRPGSVKTTDQVAESLRYHEHWNHYVPLVEPVDGPVDDLPIDPYVLGALLGDGHLRTKTDGAVEILLSSADTELVAEVNSLLSVGEFGLIAGSGIDYRYRYAQRSASLRTAVRDLGLCDTKSHTKFIPAVYANASVKSRVALLQGLLDTDGSPSAGTSAMFVTVSPALAHDVRDLVWGLGGVCTMTSFRTSYAHRGVQLEGRRAFRLRVTLPEGEVYFRLERKQAKITPAQKRGRAVRTIRSITPVDAQECQCIAIDDPDHLYVTDDYVVTHNTWLAEPDGANRATSQSMAEPVRRRVGLVASVWLDQMTEIVRYVVDRAVAAGRLSAEVEATDPKTGAKTNVPAAMTVLVTGPEIAAADAQLTAQTLLNIATGLDLLVKAGLITPEAGARAAQKAWEDYMGIPYSSDLGEVDVEAIKAFAAAQAGTAPPGNTAGNGAGDAKVVPLKAVREAGDLNGAEELHKYWTRGEGLAKWVDAPQPWYALNGFLAKYITDKDKLDRTTSEWYHDVFHRWPGQQRESAE